MKMKSMALKEIIRSIKRWGAWWIIRRNLLTKRKYNVESGRLV